MTLTVGTRWGTRISYMAWASQEEDDLVGGVAGRLPAKLDVLRSHIPPFGVLDADKRGVTHGSKTLLAEIERTHPAVTICGHVHAARGRYTFPWGGHLYNVAAVDEFRQPHGDAVVRIALPST